MEKNVLDPKMSKVISMEILMESGEINGKQIGHLHACNSSSLVNVMTFVN